MPNEPAPHPEHPYSWSVAHYVPRVVIRRGDTVTINVAAWKKADRLWGMTDKTTADADGLVQGFQLVTGPPNSRPASIQDPEPDPYYFIGHRRQVLTVDEFVTVEVWIGSTPGDQIIITAEAIVPADAHLDGFGLQVAPLDAERRREVERIRREADGQ